MNLTLTLAILPYLAGILMKVAVFCLSPLAQKTALKDLVEGHKPTNGGAFSSGQQSVVLAVLGYSTASITATSTLIMSLVTLLVIALKHHQPWLWGCWGIDAALSSCMWVLIYRLKGPHQPILKMSVGTFILVLSTSLDVYALVLTVLSINAK